MENQFIRPVNSKDSADILKIYSRYIENTAYTFEINVPSVLEFTKRVESISSFYPYLVYIINNEIVGYAYASKHKERDAYDYDVDVSVYIDEDFAGKGIGSKLYDALFDILEKQGFYNAYAGITMPNVPSEALHRKYGFNEIGVFSNTGFKFNKWYDVKWLHKVIKQHDQKPKQIIPIKDL